MFRKWKQKFASDATYQSLAQALQHPVVGHWDLAKKYCYAPKDEKDEKQWYETVICTIIMVYLHQIRFLNRACSISRKK